MEVGSSSLPGTTNRRQAMWPKADASLPGTTLSRQAMRPDSARDYSAKVHTVGGLAQLARALAWHARGHRFDPDILHSPLPLVAIGKRSLTL